MRERIKQIVRNILAEYKGTPYMDIHYMTQNNFQPLSEDVRDSEILSDTRCVINEERGINDDVTKATNYIISKINEWISNGNKQNLGNGIFKTEVAVNERIFGEELNIIVRIYDIPKGEINIIKPRSFYDENKNLLQIEFKRINGKIDYYTFYDIIQHEVNHYFQKLIRGNNPILKSNKDNLYKFVCKNMINSSNSVVKRVGIIIYISFGFEQESYGNGLYSNLTHNLDKSWDSIYCESEIYQYISFLKDCIKFLEDETNHKDIIPILKYLQRNKIANITINELIKTCRKTYHSLVKRAGKVISLVKDQYGLTESKIWY